MGLVCLDRRALAGSVDLDRALRGKASDMGPLFATSLGCEVYASSNIFYSISGPLQILVVLHGVHDVTLVC